MFKYIIKRILQAIPILFIVTLITFLLIQLAPYDAIDSMTTPSMSQETIDMIREQKGLNKPVIVQYFYWLTNVFKGDFGYSLIGSRDIGQELTTRIPNTVMLVLPAYIVSLLIACILGIWGGIKHNHLSGKIINKICGVGIAIPAFWFAMLLIYFFGYKWKIFPIVGMRTIGVENSFADLMKHYIMPFLVLVVANVPQLTRYIRSATIREMNAEYVSVQKAFGASRFEIISKHIFRNILTPIVIQVGVFLPMLITGGIITESVFSWPGVGMLFLSSARSLDYPVIMAIVFLSALLVIIGNLIVDLAIVVIDPRVREGKQ